MSVLDAESAPATPKHVTACLAKLMVAFEPNVKSSTEETRLRAAVWLESCGDIGDRAMVKGDTGGDPLVKVDAQAVRVSRLCGNRIGHPREEA